MKTMKQLLQVALMSLAALLAGCATTGGSSVLADDEKMSVKDEGYNESMTLADHLQQVSGLSIQGSGRNAQVRVHGVSSMYGNNEPLFVVNGQAIDGGLSAVSSMVPVAEIARISVLKTPSETSMYGVRGANGVVVIKLKSKT